MIYQSTSIKESIARIVRATGVQDTAYLVDMEEWIPEAMSLMRTKFTLSDKWADIPITFHRGKYPCDLRSVKAVECGGFRLKEGNSALTLDTPPSRNEIRASQVRGTTNGFETIPQIINTPPKANPQENSHYFWNDLVSTSVGHCGSLGVAEGHWYQSEMGYITTSIRDTKLRIHYRAIPCDEDGFPLIPDNGNYKKAIEFYVIACMLARGFKSPVHDYHKIMGPHGYWDEYSGKAMGEIRYPSTNSMEMKANSLNRLIKDHGYFEQFFATTHEEQKYGYSEYLYNISPGGGRTYPNPEQ